jgi:hypothetical protein
MLSNFKELTFLNESYTKIDLTFLKENLKVLVADLMRQILSEQSKGNSQIDQPLNSFNSDSGSKPFVLRQKLLQGWNHLKIEFPSRKKHMSVGWLVACDFVSLKSN